MQFERLTVKSDSGKRSKSGDVLWICECNCGGSTETIFSNLRHGKTKSCGCLAKELSAERAKKLFTKGDIECSAEGCCENTKKGGKGLCGKHYMRLKRYGDINYLTPESVRRENARNAQLNTKKAQKNTYKKLFGRHEHRVIAEEIIGRKLRSDEHVHHIDFDKHNNDPRNLSVMKKDDHLKLHNDLEYKGYTDVRFERLSEINN
jgi:hypothetical protein